jgi:hypothetical protein
MRVPKGCHSEYRICACISRTFLTRIYPPKLGFGLYTEYYVLLTSEPAMPVLYVVKLPVETALRLILQAIAHARLRRRITGVSAHFDYMRAADTIYSQKSEDRDITDKLP